jgi:hypothetical protein
LAFLLLPNYSLCPWQKSYLRERGCQRGRDWSKCRAIKSARLVARSQNKRYTASQINRRIIQPRAIPREEGGRERERGGRGEERERERERERVRTEIDRSHPPVASIFVLLAQRQGREIELKDAASGRSNAA